MEFLSKKESEIQIQYYMSLAEDFELMSTSTGRPCFLLKNQNALLVNDDGTVTWSARATIIGLHFFIELSTCETTTKTISIPICLIDPRSRQLAGDLLQATIDPKDSRFGSKDADLDFLTPDGKGISINLDLKVLALSWVSLQMLPQDFVLQMASAHCPFCQRVSQR